MSYDGADPATSPRYKYEYGANGQVSYVTDTALKRTQWTEYDLAQRPMQTYTFANANGLPQTRLYSTRLRYDKFNNLITFRENVSGTAHDTEYVYDKDDRTKKIAFRTSAKLRGIEYAYDTVNRIASVNRGTATVSSAREVTVTPNAALGTTFTFAPGDTTRYGAQASTLLVASLNHGTGANAMSFSYAYDNVGNISSETRNGAVTGYTYDNLGRLTRVNDLHQNMTWTYAYDRGGNILNKKRYAYTTGTLGTVLETINYTYGDSNWKDKLSTYDQKTITYDNIGNPLSDEIWTYTWQAGRQLATMTMTGTNASFQYDANGLRIQKTVNSDVTDYTLHGKLVMHLKRGSDNLHFFYDAQSRPAMVNFNGTLYHYVHNLQGDIVALVDDAGTKVVEYKYDAWGKPISTTGTLASTLGARNPFRYRGYVWDSKTDPHNMRGDC